MKNWKTTIIGILLIVSSTSTAALHYFQTGVLPDFVPLASAVAAGVGLLVAKDYNVTGTGTGTVAGGNVDNSKNSLTPNSNPPKP